METAIMQAQKTDCRYKKAEAYAHKVQEQMEKKKFWKKHFQAIDKATSAQNNLAVDMDVLPTVRASEIVSG